jgi:plastocyanin
MKQYWQAHTVTSVLGSVILLALAVWVSTGGGALGAAERFPNRELPVLIQLFQYQPNPVEVQVGTRVTWTNNDDIDHTVTSGTSDNQDGKFDGRLSGKGTTFSATLTQAGTHTYFCARHPFMRGEIRVIP